MEEQYVGSAQWRINTYKWYHNRAAFWFYYDEPERHTCGWLALLEAEFVRQEGLGV